MKRLLAIFVCVSLVPSPTSATDITFGGRTWNTFDVDPVNFPTYGVVGDSGTITTNWGVAGAMATPVSIAVGDVITYDYHLSSDDDNWVSESFGDFRGGGMLDTPNFIGYLITGRVGFRLTVGDRNLSFETASFAPSTSSPFPGATEDSSGLRIQWWFPTANSYQVSVTNIGSGSPLYALHGTTGGNSVTDITYFRQDLSDSIQTVSMSNFTQTSAGPAGSLVFGFENGLTGDGFKDLTAPGSVTNWIATDATIEIGDGFNLLAASEGTHRVVVNPYSERDNFGHANHRSLVLRSPTFELNGSGSLQVDMFGGRRNGENKNAADLAVHDPEHVGQLGSLQRNAAFDFAAAGETNDGKHLTGFALRNALTGEYVLFGSNGANNDGKQRPSDQFDRGQWYTVMFTHDQLAAFANDGNLYQIDFIDSFGESSWGHIGFDNLRVPGALATFAPGDTNGDGVVDATDTATVFANFTGFRNASPVAKPDGLARIHGDFSGNGDVDGGDVIENLANIGLTAPTSGSAQLIYSSTTGEVKLDAAGADGGAITTFRLTNDSDIFLSSGVTNLPFSPSPLSTDITAEVFWVDTTLTGFAGQHNLGSILPTGLTATELVQTFAGAEYVGTPGTGAFDFALVWEGLPGDFNGDGVVDAADLNDVGVGWNDRFGIDLDGADFLIWQRNFGMGAPMVASVAVPEPSTVLLALICTAGAVCIQRRSTTIEMFLRSTRESNSTNV